MNIEDILEQTTKVAVCTSRYGEPRDIYRCNVDENTYFVLGKSKYYRVGSDPDSQQLEYVDFEGGPFIMINEEFYHNKGKLPNVQSLEVVRLNGDGHFCVKLKTH